MRNTERCLIIIPIIHAADDMMSLRSSIPRDAKDEKFALAQWEKVSGYLHRLSPRFLEGLKVYQDGLPDTTANNLDKILAQAQTRNYDVLRWLRLNGAVIMGTERVELLKEEYQFLVARYHAPDEESWAEATLGYLNRRDQLLADRDVYIAQRINTTLGPHEVGLLFIGLGHNIKPLLASKMRLGEPRLFNPDRSLSEWERYLTCRSV